MLILSVSLPFYWGLIVLKSNHFDNFMTNFINNFHHQTEFVLV